MKERKCVSGSKEYERSNEDSCHFTSPRLILIHQKLPQVMQLTRSFFSLSHGHLTLLMYVRKKGKPSKACICFTKHNGLLPLHHEAITFSLCYHTFPRCSTLGRSLRGSTQSRVAVDHVGGRAWRGSCGDMGSRTDNVSHTGRPAEETEQERKQTSKPCSRLSCTQNKGPDTKQFIAL